MIQKIYPENPAPRHIKQVLEVLHSEGLIIIPTDTVYALAGSIYNIKAYDRILRLKGIKKKDAHFSFLFNDLSMLSEFTRPIENTVYKLMRKNLPGPFTFILEANSRVPKIFQTSKKTIGIRIPDNHIVTRIIEELGHPLMVTSLHDTDEIIEYMTNPDEIHDRYKDRVELVIDGGFGGNQASTVVNCVGDAIEVVREGKAPLIW